MSVFIRTDTYPHTRSNERMADELQQSNSAHRPRGRATAATSGPCLLLDLTRAKHGAPSSLNNSGERSIMNSTMVSLYLLVKP